MKLTGLSESLTDSETSTILEAYTDGASVSSYAKTAAALYIKTDVVTGSTAPTAKIGTDLSKHLLIIA